MPGNRHPEIRKSHIFGKKPKRQEQHLPELAGRSRYSTSASAAEHSIGGQGAIYYLTARQSKMGCEFLKPTTGGI